jgi:hypothetical protein
MHGITNSDTGETVTQKMPGRLAWSDVVLARGITGNKEIWAWR